MTYDINTIYTKYKQLTKKQRQQLLATLQSQGINIVKIEAYEYTDAPGTSPLQRPHYFTSSYTYLFSKKVILLSFLG